MEILAAPLGHRADNSRTLLVFGAEVRHSDLKLGDHGRIRIHRRGAVAARIGHMRAIRRNVERVSWQPVVGIGAV